MQELTVCDREQLTDYLSTRDKNAYAADLQFLPKGKLRDAARFFIPIPHSEEVMIWEEQKKRRNGEVDPCLVPEDELVEDAALTDQDVQPGIASDKSQKPSVTGTYA